MRAQWFGWTQAFSTEPRTGDLLCGSFPVKGSHRHNRGTAFTRLRVAGTARCSTHSSDLGRWTSVQWNFETLKYNPFFHVAFTGRSKTCGFIPSRSRLGPAPVDRTATSVGKSSMLDSSLRISQGIVETGLDRWANRHARSSREPCRDM